MWRGMTSRKRETPSKQGLNMERQSRNAHIAAFRWWFFSAFILLGIVCAGISSAIAANGRYATPDFLLGDPRPQSAHARGGTLTQSWDFPGVTYYEKIEPAGDRERHTLKVSTGWPYRSFGASRSYETQTAHIPTGWSRFTRVKPGLAVGTFKIYLVPQWGLLASAFTYGLVLATVWHASATILRRIAAWGETRRYRRAWGAGVCVQCGYAVSGLRICPECGTDMGQFPTS